MIPQIRLSKAKDIPKGWGKEVCVVNNANYSGKLLVYNRKNALSSMHYHTKKDETFYVFEGEFALSRHNPDTGERETCRLSAGDVVMIPVCNPHQLECLSDTGIIIEFATMDFSWDNFRIAPGDSQKPK